MSDKQSVSILIERRRISRRQVIAQRSPSSSAWRGERLRLLSFMPRRIDPLPVSLRYHPKPLTSPRSCQEASIWHIRAGDDTGSKLSVFVVALASSSSSSTSF
uniref:Antifreeze protein n=1 Tax=Chorispora bungeana TaxID=238895 RepID=Q7XBG0_CHOBU|nr:antifreeze protein [Chorispora bungeana]